MGHNLKIFQDLRKCHFSLSYCLSFDYRTNKENQRNQKEKKKIDANNITKEKKKPVTKK